MGIKTSDAFFEEEIAPRKTYTTADAFRDEEQSPPEPVQQPVPQQGKEPSYLGRIGQYWAKDLPEAGKGFIDRTMDRSRRIEAPTAIGQATGNEAFGGIPERLTRTVAGAVGTIGDAAGTVFGLAGKAADNLAGGALGKVPGAVAKAMPGTADAISFLSQKAAEYGSHFREWYDQQPEADKANYAAALDLSNALVYKAPNVAGNMLRGAGEASVGGGKKVLQSTLKIKDKTAKLAGKNVNAGVNKIVDDVVNFKLESPTGGIKAIEKNAQDAIDTRMFSNEKTLLDYHAANPTAGVNVTMSLDDLATNIRNGKVKQIFTNEDEAADFVSKINDALQKRGLHGYQTIDKLPEIKATIRDGLNAFSNGKFAIGDAPLKEFVGDLSYLKLTDDIGKHIPEFNAVNKEIHDLVNVKTAMMEAQKRIGNKNNISLMDGLALLGSGPALASMGVPSQMVPMAPLVAGVVVGKKALSNGRGASGMISAGRAAEWAGGQVNKVAPYLGVGAVAVKTNAERNNGKTRIGDILNRSK